MSRELDFVRHMQQYRENCIEPEKFILLKIEEEKNLNDW
jgi:hypothetical protein